MPVIELEPISDVVSRVAPEAVANRHHLHRNPELSHQEERTAAFVAEKLRGIGADSLRTNVGGHGIVAEIRGAGAGPIFALRADMDALPIQETNDVPYKSCVPGIMHACGHDGHTATLLGAAATLAQMRERFSGTARLLFQPAEETVGGAARMCEEGAVEGVAAIVALHGWPGMEVGQIGVRPGPMMASSDTFEIIVRGRGAHAAMPQNSIDPIVIAAQMVLALQTLASREIAPVEPVVVTVAQIHAGTAYNVIPDEATLRGTVRCLSAELRETMAERVERVARGIADAFRAEITFRYRYGTGVTVNDAAINTLVSEVGAEVLGAENVLALEHPSMGAEDFAQYLNFVPGAMFRLGVGNDVTPLHTPTYNFADAALPHGITLFTQIALRYLNHYV